MSCAVRVVLPPAGPRVPVGLEGVSDGGEETGQVPGLEGLRRVEELTVGRDRRIDRGRMARHGGIQRAR